MIKRELSSTIKNLKFMQRARQKEELVKKEEEVIPPTSGNRKCVVIMEGDPTPGAVIGRMSFQNCNPSIDKLKDESEESDKHRIPSTSTADRNEMEIDRDNGVSHDRKGGLKQNRGREYDDSEDLRRKKLKVEAEADADTQSSYRSPTNSMTNGGGQSSTSRGRKANQQGRGKLDWRLLRPPSGRMRGAGIQFFASNNARSARDNPSRLQINPILATICEVSFKMQRVATVHIQVAFCPVPSRPLEINSLRMCNTGYIKQFEDFHDYTAQDPVRRWVNG